jgi:hypothetical protein
MKDQSLTGLLSMESITLVQNRKEQLEIKVEDFENVKDVECSAINPSSPGVNRDINYNDPRRK